MPLSEHEQRMLDQIERALYAEDPKFANTVRQTNPAVHYKRWIIKAGLGFVVGIVLLMTGLMLQSTVAQVAISVLGFLVMLLCFLWGANAWRKASGSGGADQGVAVAEPKQKRRGGSRPGMMNRFEERWRRRQEGEE
ncbi:MULTISPECIES: DUF3040 domain-containing protein [Nocardiopsis]|uniref:DUF3040 domain-containing protein n=1 Tax=Nocardiopsis dassonvillei (strain ATCC 23218 / DSM 43111 / CIP 107115 / JCM 7437 / KCTC 9190 / NBRC 14626 / NCTC 10488 / NRRL B-5397 / IMRU 509) TaxID=446468 RepID=D7AZN5_NOCDD|nr:MULTISPECIES: DUF3040 domain-containing protein [Nocardiopsis]ADH66327.1 conserved hypothetical protein [Nocardiopsis dassonvillei subsp. dassonvillei DSM 43111]APC34648.1 hypothetical protein A9R04_08055 [Nocardiopsis dassonvillei]ASU57513.1 DUF3040 domain-containing protein [Nocardiopsis dassonvillei]MCP3016762.1 DUF3040 domain-containing protein [Nocardiopsis dassonvillei]NKY79147.1 DUF3040 domain-containing protein [Nocardiopsis dassonvillei]